MEEIEACSDNGGLASSFDCDCFTVAGRDKDRGRDGDKQSQTEGIFALNSITQADTHLVHTLFSWDTHPVHKTRNWDAQDTQKKLGCALAERLLFELTGKETNPKPPTTFVQQGKAARGFPRVGRNQSGYITHAVSGPQSGEDQSSCVNTAWAKPFNPDETPFLSPFSSKFE